MKRRNIIIIVAGTIVMCLGLVVLGSLLPQDSTPTPAAIADDTAVPEATIIMPPTDTPKATATTLPTETPQPTDTPDPGFVGIGTHIVGDDIVPGIYRGEAGNNMLDSCYWEKLSDLSGEFSAVIANANPVGQYYVRVEDSDYAFRTTCDLSLYTEIQVSEFPTTIPAGMYLVGLDIQAGSYRGEAGTEILESCYWERLEDITGGFDPVISNDNGIGQFFVEVQEGDFALLTSCDLELVATP